MQTVKAQNNGGRREHQQNQSLETEFAVQPCSRAPVSLARVALCLQPHNLGLQPHTLGTAPSHALHSCLIDIKEGMENLSEYTAAEQNLLGDMTTKRLACQAKIMKGKVKYSY